MVYFLLFMTEMPPELPPEIGLTITGATNKGDNPCAMLGCFECCRNMRISVNGKEAREFLTQLRTMGIDVSIRFIDKNSFRSFNDLTRHSTETEKDEVLVVLPFKYDRSTRTKRPINRIDEIGDETSVLLIFYGDCPFLGKLEENSRQCTIYGNKARPSACDNFDFDPITPGSSCRQLREERGIT